MTTAIPARSSIASNALATFGGQLGTWLLTALTFLLIPRYLGPENTGVASIGWVFAVLGTTAAGLGMTPLITREVARDPHEARSWMGTAVWLNVLLGSIAAVMSVGIALALGYRPLVVLSVLLHAVLIPAILVSSIGSAIFQGLEIMRYSAAFNVTLKLGILLAAVVAILADLGLIGVLILTNAVPLIVAVIQVVILQRIFVFRLLSFSRPAAVALCKVSIPFFAVTVAWVIYHSIDVLLLSLLTSEADVGYYSVPARVFGALLFIPTTIAIVTFPRFAAAVRERPNDLAQMADQVLRITVAAGIAVTLGSIALSDDVLIGLLGSEFAKAGPVIVVIAISLVPTGIGAVLARMAFAMDRQAAVATIGALAIPGRLLLVLPLILVFDGRFENAAVGAVLGFVIAETGVALAMLRFAPRGTFSIESLYFYTRIGAALAVSIVVLTLAWAPLGSLMAGLLASMVYCAGVLMLRAYTVTDVLGFARAMLGGRFDRAPASA